MAIEPEKSVATGRDFLRASRPTAERFCMTLAFFCVWALMRQQPDPMLHLRTMLIAAYCGSLLMARYYGDMFTDRRLNHWDEGVGYLLVALFIDVWKQL